MLISDFKLYVINFITLGVTMMDIEWWLKIILLLVTIGYTITKWWKIKK
jgi:hypothetical protein